MAEHYYSVSPESEHDEKKVIFEILGNKLECITDASVFSRDGLDMGTRVLLEAIPDPVSTGIHRVLDLGCGWGAVGIALGKKYPALEIVMSDINERAVSLSMRNALSNEVRNTVSVQGDGYESIEGSFDLIALNPPIRTGKQVIYDLFLHAREHLSDSGRLMIVIRKQQGAESAEKYLKEIYRSVQRVSREKGYWVFECMDGKGMES